MNCLETCEYADRQGRWEERFIHVTSPRINIISCGWGSDFKYKFDVSCMEFSPRNSRKRRDGSTYDLIDPAHADGVQP